MGGEETRQREETFQRGRRSNGGRRANGTSLREDVILDLVVRWYNRRREFMYASF